MWQTLLLFHNQPPRQHLEEDCNSVSASPEPDLNKLPDDDLPSAAYSNLPVSTFSYIQDN